MENKEWVICPNCGGKTRTCIRNDTILIKFPLYCPKCRREFLITVSKNKITEMSEPDA